MQRDPDLSVVIPCHNEAENLEALFAALRPALDALPLRSEIIVTDDGSADASWAMLCAAAKADPRLRGQRLGDNYGESAASWAGIRAARGRFIATLDADLQNDPGELPRFLEALKQYDCVCGARSASRAESDGFLRNASSRTANWVRNRLSGEQIADSGCTYRVFKRECVADLKFFDGMHRFLPTLIKMEGFTVTEIPIINHPRLAGRSHYGVWNRLFASFYDLLAVRWMRGRMFPHKIADRIN